MPVEAFGPDTQPGGYPPELNIEAQSLARKRALANALLGRSLQPLQEQPPVGGIAVPISPLQGIAGLLQQYFAGKGGQNVDTQEAALGQRYAQSQQASLERLMKGSPTEDRELMQAAGGYGPQAKVAAAMLEARNKARYEGMISPKALLTAPDTSVSSRADAINGGGVSVLRPKPTTAISEGQVISTTPGEIPGVLADLGRTYSNQVTPSPKGPVLTRTQSGTGKTEAIEHAPSTSVTANVGIAGPKAGATKIFEDASKTVSDLGQAARAGQNIKDGLARLQEMDKQGIFSNKTSGMKTWGANLAQALGAPLSEKQANMLGNTEGFTSVITDLWQQKIAQAGGNRGVTHEEAEQMKSMLPQAATSPQARQIIYQILGNVADRQAAQFRTANRNLTEALKKEDPSLWQQNFDQIFLPQVSSPSVATPTAQPSGPMSFSKEELEAEARRRGLK